VSDAPHDDFDLVGDEAERMLVEIDAQECEESLALFTRRAWPIIDPAEYRHNWHLEAVAEHLTAVSMGHIKKLAITEPPRTSKSTMVAAMWPAWVWTQSRRLPLSGPHVKFIGVSYDPRLSIRDATKSRRIIDSEWFQERYGRRFRLLADMDQAAMYENNAGGFRYSTSVEGGLTGSGGDVIIVDDPISAKKSNWETARENVNTWWDETVQTRLNDQQTGAKIVIMQRLHEDDLVGHILDREDGWVHLNLPMEYDPALDTRTWVNGHAFYEDPRTEPDELLWPERFPRHVVDALKTSLGPFAAAAQLQQQPTPRGGSIIDRMWWQAWPAPGFDASRFPACSLIVGSVDTAYGDKEENAFNAMTVWGAFQDQRERANIVMMEAWRARLPLLGVYPDDARDEEERKPYWGLSEKIADTVMRRQMDVLLIEDKTRGGDLAAEIRRLLRRYNYECSIVMIMPEGNKIARLHACQPMFADGRVWAPEKAWADTVITEVSQFPKSKYADYTDTCSMAISWLRNNGIVMLGTESDSENLRRVTCQSKSPARYDV
jgi:predicted phage terminase large subunit-like protein